MIWDILLYLLLFAVLAAGGFVGYVLLQQHLSGGTKPGFFGPKPEKRLDVVEQWSLDARRRLVLIRRDDVEHLIMTGGPVDVVIETGIGAPAPLPAVVSEPVYQRAPRQMAPAAAPTPATTAVPASQSTLNGGLTD